MGKSFLENLKINVPSATPAPKKDATVIGDAAIESMLFLTHLKEKCSDKELAEIAKESAIELELYGILKNADSLTDAAKLSKPNHTAMEASCALKLAELSGDENFAKYQRYAKLANLYLGHVMEAYGEMATEQSSALIGNWRRKASGIKTDSGKNVVAKLS